MGFSETLKKLVDQGMEVSKEAAAKAGEKAQDWGTKGLKASQNFAAKAGAKIQEMGEKSALKLEIKHLEGQTRKLISFLGAAVYSLYEQEKPFSADIPEMDTIFSQINTMKEQLEKKEIELTTKFPK